MNMKIIGKRIRLLRQENNYTQEQFGKIFGLVKSTVSLYESGKSNPDDEIKRKIADYFDVSIDWLLGRTEERSTVDKIVNKNNQKAFEIEEILDRFRIRFEGQKLTKKDIKSVFSFLRILRDRD